MSDNRAGKLTSAHPRAGLDAVDLLRTVPRRRYSRVGHATRIGRGLGLSRVGRRGVIVAGLTVCSAAVWSLPAAATPWPLATSVMVYAAGVAVTTVAASAFITDVARRARYGTAHGVFGTIYDVGDALGPITAGFVVAASGYAPMFRGLAAVGLAMAVVFALVSRPGARRAPAAAGAPQEP